MADDSWKDFYFMNLGFADDKPAGTNVADPFTNGTQAFGVPNPATSELTQPAGSHWRVSQASVPVGTEKHITLWKSGELELVDTTGASTAVYDLEPSGAPYNPTFTGMGLRLAAKESTSSHGVDIVSRMASPPDIGPSNARPLVWRTPEVAGMIQGTGGGVPVADQETTVILGHYGYVSGLTLPSGDSYRDRCWLALGTRNLGATWERVVNIGLWANSWVPASGQPVTFPAAARVQPFNENSGEYAYEWMFEIPQEDSFFPYGTFNTSFLLINAGSSFLPAWVPGGDGFSPFAAIHNNETAGSTCTSAVITNWQYRWMKFRGISP